MCHVPGARPLHADAERTPATASAVATVSSTVGSRAPRQAGAQCTKKDRIVRLLFERLGGLSMAARLRQIFVLRVSILLVTFPLVSSAQLQPAAVPAPLQLTLRQAVQLALKQNPQRIIAQLLVSESDRNSQIARSALLPQANMEAHGALSQYNLNSVEARPPQLRAGPYQFIEAGPSFSQTLLSLPQIRGYQIGREGTREARADEQTTRETVVGAIVE